ncbi:hypothetical protein AAF712_013047 [Marasmius tenuissimus]|uniref:Transmembrane protein n=1 Tax=Marasmius tenuissimus TaxID=585030 RepID=A0ABR2ZHF5_9AGAR
MVDPELDYPRRVVVDDTDPRIIYDKPDEWDWNGSQFKDDGVLGQPYNNTMRGTRSRNAGFTFTFEGDFIQVRGAKDNTRITRSPSNSTYDSLDLLPKYTCQVDNKPIESINYNDSMYFKTNLVLCQQSRLSKEKHILTMNITVDDPSTQVFWLDSIEYSPLEYGNLENEVLKVDSSDRKSCIYHNEDRNWQASRGNLSYVNVTDVPGATMSFKFNGTSAALYGLIGRNAENSSFLSSFKRTSGYYRIDNGESKNFDIPESSPPPSESGNYIAVWSNQLLFNTSPVTSDGEHEIVVSYSGNHSGTGSPQLLAIDYFLVTNKGAQLNSSTPKDPVPSQLAADVTGPNNKARIGAIVGGVVGGLLAVAAFSWLIWFMMKRRGRGSGSGGDLEDEELLVSPFDAWGDEPPLRARTAPRKSAGFLANLVRGMRQTRQERDSGYREIVEAPAASVSAVPPPYTAL